MRLRLIGLRFTDLVHGSYQMNLFEDNAQLINLYQAMDAIKMRYGNDAIGRAVGFNFST
ncbi:DNA polymerase IV [compost metagenome]